jgi:hypothetical protein
MGKGESSFFPPSNQNLDVRWSLPCIAANSAAASLVLVDTELALHPSSSSSFNAKLPVQSTAQEPSVGPSV